MYSPVPPGAGEYVVPFGQTQQPDDGGLPGLAEWHDVPGLNGWFTAQRG